LPVLPLFAELLSALPFFTSQFQKPLPRPQFLPPVTLFRALFCLLVPQNFLTDRVTVFLPVFLTFPCGSDKTSGFRTFILLRFSLFTLVNPGSTECFHLSDQSLTGDSDSLHFRVSTLVSILRATLAAHAASPYRAASDSPHLSSRF